MNKLYNNSYTSNIKSCATILALCAVSLTVRAEEVVEISMDDVGQGATVYNATLDGVQSAFRFSPINQSLNTFTDARGKPCYAGAQCFSTNIALLDTASAQSAGSFSDGFDFAGSPFIPKTIGPVDADITAGVMTFTSLPFAGEYGGVEFKLHPESPAEYAASGLCGFPHLPIVVDWVQRVGETDDYIFKARWNSCIHADSGDTTPYDISFDGFSAHWIMEGTATVEDNVAPTIASTNPVSGATAVPSKAPIVVNFSEPMNAASVISGMTVAPTAGGPSECSSITASNGNKTFTCAAPAAALGFTNLTEFTVTLPATITDDVSKVRGGGTTTNAFAGTTYTIDIGVSETVAPMHTGNVPADAATDVAVDAAITVSFNEAMDSATTIPAISLSADGVPVGAVVASSDNLNFTITPDVNLQNNTVYTIDVAATATDVSLNALGTPVSTTFTTVATGNLSAMTPDGTGTATVSVTAAGVSLVTVDVLALSEITATAPADVEFEDEFISFVINGVTGGQAEVTVQFPSDITGKTLYKVIGGTYTELAEGTAVGEYQVVDSTTITMTIADDGPQDEANTTAGVIADPIVAGLLLDIPVPGSLGGGCSIVEHEVDVMSRLDMLLLFMLPLFIYLYRRCRH